MTPSATTSACTVRAAARLAHGALRSGQLALALPLAVLKYWPDGFMHPQFLANRAFSLLFLRQPSTLAPSLVPAGHPDGNWSVDLPVEEVPPELPEPALGINFARDGEFN